MYVNEAIRFLDPETTSEAVGEIEYYGGFNGKQKAIEKINESCDIAVAVMNAYQQIQFYLDKVTETENLSKTDMEDILKKLTMTISNTSQQLESIDKLYGEKPECLYEEQER